MDFEWFCFQMKAAVWVMQRKAFVFRLLVSVLQQSDGQLHGNVVRLIIHTCWKDDLSTRLPFLPRR